VKAEFTLVNEHFTDERNEGSGHYNPNSNG